MRRVGRGMWLIALCLAFHVTEARAVRDTCAALPSDTRLVTGPDALTALLADHTVRGLYLPQGRMWREHSAPAGRTGWKFEGYLYPGAWRLSGSAICYVYPTWDDDGRPQCFVVYQSAQLTHLVWLDPATRDQWLVNNAHEIAEANPDSPPAGWCGAAGSSDPAV